MFGIARKNGAFSRWAGCANEKTKCVFESATFERFNSNVSNLKFPVEIERANLAQQLFETV